MKYKNIILLGILIFVLTGCTAEVNINLSDTSIKESVVIIDNNVNGDVNNKYRRYVPIYYNEMLSDTEEDIRNEGYTYYDRSVKELDGGYKITYSDSYLLKDYNNSNTLKSNFKSGTVEYSVEDGTVNIYTDSNGILAFNKYDELSEVKVNITTDLEVLESNADQVNKNTYTWIITKDNTERNIYLQAKNRLYDEIHHIDKKEDKKKKENENEQEENEKEGKKGQGYLWIIAIVALIGFPLLFVLISMISAKLSR